MDAVNHVPADAKVVVILNALDVIRNVLGAITHVYLHAKAYAKPHVILGALKVAMVYVNPGVHPGVLTHAVLSVHVSVLVSATIHALDHVQVIAQVHQCHTQYINQV